MNTKTCKGCGWVYPANYSELRCRFCGTAFTERICRGCGELKTMCTEGSLLCVECNKQRIKQYPDYTRSKRNKEYMIREIAKVEARYEAWLKRIAAAPFKPLTEEQWIQACRFFEGCALCNNTSIDARGYFIAFKYGGRYVAWNILPLCEKCETDLKVCLNPFRRLDRKFNSNVALCRGISVDKMNRAAQYLQDRLEEAWDE